MKDVSYKFALERNKVEEVYNAWKNNVYMSTEEAYEHTRKHWELGNFDLRLIDIVYKNIFS